MSSKNQILKIHQQDNIIVALEDISMGSEIDVDGERVVIKEFIQIKHKFSQHDLNVNDTIIQYGIPVGLATTFIPKGCAITTSNVRHISQDYSTPQSDYHWDMPDVSKWQESTFNGVKRDDGQVGTANYWIVLPLVFCQNRNVETLRHALQDSLGYGLEQNYVDIAQTAIKAASRGETLEEYYSAPASRDFPDKPLFENVDGVKFITHSSGCGGTREDAQSLCKLLAGYINHPNVAGATVLSLGCQNAQIDLLKSELEKLNAIETKSILWFEQQDYGLEADMLKDAITKTVSGIAQANKVQPEPLPLSSLKIGVESGGSDGFSGITANPLIGQVVDQLIALNGTAVLAEFPELCGVEQNIINRCITDDSSNKFIALMRAYEQHANAVGARFDMNPSPGNIKDGLITDAMKSAGAALKGGSSPITDVLDYTQMITKNGLNLLCTPGNDVESTTALVSSGVNLVLFSTGLGTPTGNPIVPVLKISSNSLISQKMSDIIDFDAGSLINKDINMKDLADELFELCIETASGDYKTKAMRLLQDDFIPWKRDVSL